MAVKRYDSATSSWVTVAGVGAQGPAGTNGSDGSAPLTTKGDLLTRSSTAVTRLGVGTNGQVLTADSAEATGLKWAAASSPTFVGASVYKSAVQSINNSTYTLLTFDAENFDTDNLHSNTTNTSRMTIPTGKAGKYLVGGGIWFATNTTGIRIIEIMKNSATLTYVQVASASTENTVVVPNYVIDCAAGDYIEIRAYQNSGGALNVNSSSVASVFQVSYLGA